MSDNHYDGESPNEPLPPDHFTRQQREEAANLGDGSPGLDQREGQETDRDRDDDDARKVNE